MRPIPHRKELIIPFELLRQTNKGSCAKCVIHLSVHVPMSRIEYVSLGYEK